MSDVRNDWFMQQNFTKEELEKLYQWETKSQKVCVIAGNEDDGFNAFHIEDAEHLIDLCYMKKREMLLRWISRLGYVTNDGETFKGD